MAGERPSGTVALLFTDIEGSTKLWEQHPDEMSAALLRHDAILREVIESRRGHIFKTVGDAFCAAFSDAGDAVAAAVEAQREIGRARWPEQTPMRVRMGVHAGVCEERDGDYFGPPVNRTARLESIAHGGQIVVSGAGAELAGPRLAADVSLRDLGMHRLKDLGRPEHVFQVGAPGLAGSFPALRSLDNADLRHNLPAQVAPFIGRVDEVAEVNRLVHEHRLVTMVGPGGAGKTRLALQVAVDLLDGAGDGVWLVDLAPLTDPDLVPTAVAGVLGLHAPPGQPVIEHLIGTLRDQSMLLVLDNCEHLVEAVAEVGQAILGRCARVTLLATSREPLGLAGERVFRVPSMSLPPLGEASVERLASCDAISLFVDRAAQHRGDFRCDATNAERLASLCRRLDGIPLAIELAAARLRGMPLDELEARLDQRFRLLTGGSRTALKRQQTLQAMMDWSFDLLRAAEQQVLCRMAVFAGGFTLEAAEHVLAFGDVDELDVVDLVATLVDKSLVQLDDADDGARYRLLETVRDYAAARLAQVFPADAEAARHAHVEYFIALVARGTAQMQGPSQFDWLERLDREFDNFRAALAFAGSIPDPDVGLRLAWNLDTFWLERGSYRELIDTLTGLVERATSTDDLTYGRALATLGELHEWGGSTDDALRYLQRALTIAGDQGDPALASDVSRSITRVLTHRDAPDAIRHADAAVEHARRAGDQHRLARSLHTRSNASGRPADHPATVDADIHDALALYRAFGDNLSTSRALTSLAMAALDAGDAAMARPYLVEALALQGGRTVGEARSIGLFNLALVDVILDEVERAAELVPALVTARRHGQLALMPYLLLVRAVIVDRRGDPESAAAVLAVADRVISERRQTFESVEAHLRQVSHDRIRSAIGDEAFDAAYARGAATGADVVFAQITAEA